MFIHRKTFTISTKPKRFCFFYADCNVSSSNYILNICDEGRWKDASTVLPSSMHILFSSLVISNAMAESTPEVGSSSTMMFASLTSCSPITNRRLSPPDKLRIPPYQFSTSPPIKWCCLKRQGTNGAFYKTLYAESAIWEIRMSLYSVSVLLEGQGRWGRRRGG
mmetsp:Transcript_4730/g.7296  ORF Transcript_4730/g.7296 Transcript_4730/m.7296 type:complete len:164 (+) Transcript_4730:1007-1498(+)